AELIDTSSRLWKKELIDSTFPKEVADRILRIPLAVEPHDDFLAWSGEPLGEYTVCNAYKLLQSIKEDPRTYALQTDYKVNMQHRKLTNTTICPRCESGTETMDHLCQECPASVSVLREFFVAFYGQYGEKGTLECIESKWKHPPDQFVKINFDTAYDGRFCHSALGIVVRNSESKALACRRATQLDIDMKWKNIIIEVETLKSKKEIYLIGRVPEYAEKQKEMDSVREPD
ncbi:hypothetical protein Goari_008873, partial [Gossypium aridum]|nr:hypothetical protein [Gossypium aridum]